MSKKYIIKQKHRKTKKIHFLNGVKPRKNVKKGGDITPNNETFTPDNDELRDAIAKLSSNNFDGPSIDTWDTSKVTNMDKLFENFSDFNGDISNWDVSNVTSMEYMFFGCETFNQPLNNWDVSNVTSMEGMFAGCENFNGDISNWNVSNVTSMGGMFQICKKFDQPLNWDVSKVTFMRAMFEDCEKFNGDISNWNVSKVTSMKHMFAGCKKFNQPLNNWNVSKVTSMICMFDGCINFNGNISNWVVSNVEFMSRMFEDCEKFNGDISNWDVSKVTSMKHMFAGCINFNQPLNNWDVSNVTSMESMFQNCKKFNQPLNNWFIYSDTNLNNMFKGCVIADDNKPTITRTRMRNLPPPPPPPPRADEDAYFPLSIPQVSFKEQVLSHEAVESLQTLNAYDPIEGDVKIKDAMDEDEDKILFKFGKSFYLITKPQIKTIYDNHNETIFGCYVPGTVSDYNLCKNEPYFYLNKIGIISGIVQYGYIKYILETNTTRYYEIVPATEGRKEWKATTTGEILGRNPRFVGAHHCQEGTSKKIYEIYRLKLKSDLDNDSPLPIPPPISSSSVSVKPTFSSASMKPPPPPVGGKKLKKKNTKKMENIPRKKNRTQPTNHR